MGINFLKLPDGYFEVRYLGGKDYQKSTDMFLSVIKYYIKLGRSLDGSGLYGDEFDSYRMAIINLAHSYLLSGNTTKAKELYNKEIFKKDFISFLVISLLSFFTFIIKKKK